MLSRIAESLFWIGRYVERAEDTARLLEVHVSTMLQDPDADEEAACRSLLTVMGVGVGTTDRPRVRDTVERLAFDHSGSASIVGAWLAARENARGIRESISSELWECLNATHNALPYEQARAQIRGPHSFCAYVRERAAIVDGLSSTTLRRDAGWRFLALGRSLERVDMTTRMLALHPGDGAGGWVRLLLSCGAYEAFLRTYHGNLDGGRVTEFLLLDGLYPRSVFFALTTAERCLSALYGDQEQLRGVVDDEARRLLGRARNHLEFLSVEELLVDLPTQLFELQRMCSQVSDAVTARFFYRDTPAAWLVEASA